MPPNFERQCCLNFSLSKLMLRHNTKLVINVIASFIALSDGMMSGSCLFGFPTSVCYFFLLFIVFVVFNDDKFMLHMLLSLQECKCRRTRKPRRMSCLL